MPSPASMFRLDFAQCAFCFGIVSGDSKQTTPPSVAGEGRPQVRRNANGLLLLIVVLAVLALVEPRHAALAHAGSALTSSGALACPRLRHLGHLELAVLVLI